MRHRTFVREDVDSLAYGVDAVGNRAADFGQSCGIEVAGAGTRITGNPEAELDRMFAGARSRKPYDPALHDGNLFTNTGNSSGPVG